MDKLKKIINLVELSFVFVLRRMAFSKEVSCKTSSEDLASGWAVVSRACVCHVKTYRCVHALNGWFKKKDF